MSEFLEFPPSYLSDPRLRLYSLSSHIRLKLEEVRTVSIVAVCFYGKNYDV